MSINDSTMRNMVLVLGCISLLAGVTLAGVSVLTSEPIELAQREKKVSSIREVLPAFDNEPPSEVVSVDVAGVGPMNVYPARMGDEPVGYAVESFSGSGFGGLISVMVGFDAGGVVTGYSVLDHAETPGLGDQMVDWFKPVQAPERSGVERLFGFTVEQPERNSNILGRSPGEEPFRVSKDGGSVDAITAATITSRAFLEAVNRAYLAYSAYVGEEADADAMTGATQKN